MNERSVKYKVKDKDIGREAKKGNIVLENQLEEMLFGIWLTSSDSTVGIEKRQIRDYIMRKVADEKERSMLIEQLEETSKERLFRLFSIGDAA